MKSIENVVYKVVGKQTRHCTNWHLYSCRYSVRRNRKKYLRKYPFLKSFLPRYLKNSIVKMSPKSVGILTFDNEYNALKFIEENGLVNIKIIKVKGIHQLNSSRISRSCGFDPRMLSKTFSSDQTITAPFGTLFFEKVKVLE